MVSKAVFFLGFCLLLGVEESGYRHLRGNKACGLLTALVLISGALTGNIRVVTMTADTGIFCAFNPKLKACGFPDKNAFVSLAWLW